MRVTRYFFDIIVDNERKFDFSRCRHFLGHRITPKIGESLESQFEPFRRNF